MEYITSKSDILILWASGVILFVHVMNFLAVSYFGQMTVAFFLIVGAIVTAAKNSGREFSGLRSPNKITKLRVGKRIQDYR